MFIILLVNLFRRLFNWGEETKRTPKSLAFPSTKIIPSSQTSIVGDRWMFVNDTPTRLIPPYEVLRIWVQFINGNEGELHSAFIPDYGWDLPTGLRINVLKVIAWQRILPPPLQPAKINYDGNQAQQALSSKVKPMHNTHLPEIQAQLQEIVCPKQIAVAFTLSKDYIVQLYLTQGTLLENAQQVTYFTVPENLGEDKKIREIIAWIGPLYYNQVIHLGTVEEPPNQENIVRYLAHVANSVKESKTKELQQIYEWLQKNPDFQSREPEHLYDALFKINYAKELTRYYSHSLINQRISEISSHLNYLYGLDRERWIQESGSKQIRYLLRNNYDVEEVYVKERLQQEMPGFTPIKVGELWQRKNIPDEADVEIAENFPNSVIVVQEEKTAILMLGFLGIYPVIAFADDLKKHLPNTGVYRFRSFPRTINIFKPEPVTVNTNKKPHHEEQRPKQHPSSQTHIDNAPGYEPTSSINNQIKAETPPQTQIKLHSQPQYAQQSIPKTSFLIDDDQQEEENMDLAENSANQSLANLAPLETMNEKMNEKMNQPEPQEELTILQEEKYSQNGTHQQPEQRPIQTFMPGTQRYLNEFFNNINKNQRSANVPPKPNFDEF